MLQFTIWRSNTASTIPKKKLDSYIRRDIYISHFYTFMRIWPVIKSADIFLTVTDAECVYFAFQYLQSENAKAQARDNFNSNFLYHFRLFFLFFSVFRFWFEKTTTNAKTWNVRNRHPWTVMKFVPDTEKNIKNDH